ncbi:phosphomannomutase (plasmid) [Paroceanicella profunda]|uniref:Phosphomannomutase n=1 Tax=Paroceanicella profunda TaxID=2579971 RepID=A0A5B8G5N8_9RHOB|nr:phosphomannomutase [Paroceanicella profunda]QDL94789.1 phosphomannomutase [Paroceanicella profunda]
MPASDLSLPSAPLTCFKAYDIRGRLGIDLDEAIARRIGLAFARVMLPGTVVVGGDCRASSTALKAALAEGLRDGGADVIDLGLCGTEEIYFATAHLGCGGGIEVTASHNPIDYNGMKLVAAGARPLDPGAELGAIRALAEAGPAPAPVRGSYREADTRAAYVEKVLSFADLSAFRPLKILVNAGNGTAGPAFDAIEAALAAAGAPLTFVKLHHTPDGSFPNGIPNPLLPGNQPVTAEAVRAHGADFGVAWDGDFDRCFLFDETGAFIDGYYIVGLLAQQALTLAPGATIIHDPRMTWNTLDIVGAAGGRAVQSNTGHALIKAAMRREGAVYGGEMSAHHYFAGFMNCDSGMIPWLMIAELVSRAGRPLSTLVSERLAKFPGSGERNFTIADPEAALARVFAAHAGAALAVDWSDGLSMEFADWRFNLRRSQTEPLVRLNLETRGDAARVEPLVGEIVALL